jgi:cell division protein FtsN
MKTEARRRLRIIKAITCAIIIATLLLLIGFATFKDVEPIEKFKVVDQYQGCEVIRYTDPTNRWNYLLKCT